MRNVHLICAALLTLGCLLAGPAACPVLGQNVDERAWQRFLQWLPSNPPTDNPAPIFARYREHLLATEPAAAADQQLAVVRRMLRARTDGWRVMFNMIYAHANPGFSVQPNAALVEAVKQSKPGRALDVGMGQGRNSVFLALKGWDVTGFDISDEGLNVARKNAVRAGVKINAVLQSNDEFDFGSARWDLIVVTYEPVPLADAGYVRRLGESLRPGGLIVIESFASDSSSPNRRPVDIDPQALRRAFGEFRILRFEDKVAMPDWGKEQTRLVRLVAQKR